MLIRFAIAVVAVLIFLGGGGVSVTRGNGLPSAAVPDQTCPSTITHSSSQVIEADDTLACTAQIPPYSHAESSYWRAFQMATFNNGQQYDITSVSFGINMAQSATGAGQPATVYLYLQTTGSFPGGTRRLLAAAPVTVMDQTLTVLSVPITATVPAGTSELVMELYTPDAIGLGHRLFIGANRATETGPGYISANRCNVPGPATFKQIGAPNVHIVMNVHGNCRTGTTAPALALNISTRLRVELGDNAMIAGFILTGTEPKGLVVRGIGPSLPDPGMGGVLADPVLSLRGSDGIPIFENDNWRDAQQTQILDTIYQPANDLESAMIQTLQPGAYSAILTGKNNTTGLGLVEVYDNNQGADAELANLSTRGLVQTGNNVMIGGFILGGNTGTSRVAIRGVGPSLAQAGLSNVLPDPTLELHDSNGATLISNDNWRDDAATMAEFQTRGLALQNDLESGIFATLPPGAFTAILAGKNGVTGIGLVELYNFH